MSHHMKFVLPTHPSASLRKGLNYKVLNTKWGAGEAHSLRAWAVESGITMQAQANSNQQNGDAGQVFELKKKSSRGFWDFIFK
jgi:hypothetical protein